MSENPIDKLTEHLVGALVKVLYDDVKSWLVGAAAPISRMLQSSRTQRLDSPSALLNAVRSGAVGDGARVKLQCKPSLFGPYLRRHFLFVMPGFSTGDRLGPVLAHPQPAIGLLAQATSHLTPVGLYPAPSNDIVQACLYPWDVNAFGFTGELVRLLGTPVESIPALISARYVQYCNMPCSVTGVVRLVSPGVAQNAGVSPEVFEEIRQKGDVWFFDATGDDAECVPTSDVTGEMWGGLYASGHIEFESGQTLPFKGVLEGMAEAFAKAGFKSPQIRRIEGTAGGFFVSDAGIRAWFDRNLPRYSLHMDAELAIDFARSRAVFDSVCANFLKGLAATAQDCSVELKNPLDLDFTYTDSAKAFTVLQSEAARKVSDPLAVAVRDWHRRRIAPSE